MTDSEKELVNRLRAWADPVESGYEIPAAGRSMREAADAIERLVRERDEARAERDRDCIALGLEIKALRNDAEAAEAEVEKLKAALTPFVTLTKTDGPVWYYENADDSVIVRCELTVGEIRQARAALEEAKHD